MTIKFVNVVFFTLLFLAIGHPLNANKSSIPEYVRLYHQFLKSFVKEVETELDFYCEGDGARMPHDIEEIEIYFTTNRRATIEEARQLEIYLVEKLVRAINTSTELRPFLHEYPFTPSRAEIRISFNNPSNRGYSDGTIALVSNINNKIHYRSHDPVKSKYEHIFIEPYEEALKIVQRVPFDLEELLRHQPFPYEDHVDQLFRDFVKEVKKKWGLYCLEEGGQLADGIEEVSFRFVTDKRTPIDKARKLYIAITERLNEILNADPVLRPYFKQYPFPIDKTRVCIHFQKKPYSYYTDGTVAFVYPENDKILYFTEKPMIDGIQPIRPVPLAEENYRDAKQVILDSSK